MEFIEERARTTMIYNYYDTVVVGGGIAGVSAALAAKRAGANKVLLIEKQYALGGLATLGLVTIYLPLCDGKGNQVSYGISEELLRLSIQYGAEDKYPDAWLEDKSTKVRENQRFEVRYNASVFAILMEQLLIKEGVTILYGTAVCGVDVSDARIRCLFIENKSGRSAVMLKNVVDASGDADVCKYSNIKTIEFQQKNVLAAWYYYQETHNVDLKILGFADIPDKLKKKEEESNLQNRYTGLDAEELTKMTIDSHRILLDDFLKSGGISDTHNLTSMASIPQIRMTRRIEGLYTLDDIEDHKYFEDSIGMISDWRKSGPVYEIPFSCLIGREVSNLITAGRCISVTDAMWDISRVIPACAVTGEAAGTAAALTGDFMQFDVKELQAILSRNGVKLHL